MFKNPFEEKKDYIVIENMFDIIRNFSLRNNHKDSANLVSTMITIMKVNFEQFTTIYPNLKNEILKENDKNGKESLIPYFKVIEDQISQFQVKEVIEEVDVEDIEKIQENMELTQDQIKAAEELKAILKKEKEDETLKDEFSNFLSATKDLISYPMHKHAEHKEELKNKNETLAQKQLIDQKNSNDLNSNIVNNDNKGNVEIKDIKDNEIKSIKKEEISNGVNISKDVNASKNINTLNNSKDDETKLDAQEGEKPEEKEYNLKHVVVEEKVSNPIVNLILSQLNDVVNMMNELSTKMKEIDKNNLLSINQLNNLKENVKNYNDRIMTLENNVEKFVGLYEVFMNEYNPFLDNDSKN